MDPHAHPEPSAWVRRFAPLIPAGGSVLDLAQVGRLRGERSDCDGEDEEARHRGHGGARLTGHRRLDGLRARLAAFARRLAQHRGI